MNLETLLPRWQALANDRPDLAYLGRHCSLSLCLRIDDTPWFVEIEQGRVRTLRRGPFQMRAATLTVAASEAAWRQFWQPRPPRGFHDLFAMNSYGHCEISGDMASLRAALPYLKALLALPRELAARPGVMHAHHEARPVPTEVAVRFEPIVGRYVHMPIESHAYRIYFEEAGAGIPLVCLHTAGAHASQFRHLMCDEAITSRYRVIAFDLPWHGKSNPPADWARHPYQLTHSFYVDAVMGFCRALGLEQAVVMGCSMGGRVVFPLAAEYGAELRAVIGLEATDAPSPWWDDSWLGAADFASGEFCAALISGLCGPTSPPANRAETLWHYQQGGSYVFEGDMHFFRSDSEFSRHVERIDTSECAVYLMTGEYDYSCRAESSAATAARIPGASATTMAGLGHFPMIEDPARFRDYLLPVLDEIASPG